ncbi:MAG: F0F1 ATP synthase subunit gamma [Burkholderiales bacterium]|nr:F0F1 ATP synthase subunit gamma [Burkholderiales bacterium]
MGARRSPLLHRCGSARRRCRQEAITTELLDIVAGYEALHGPAA